MLGIFTAAFSSAGEIQFGPGAESISVGAYLPGMLAAGMLLSGVQNLAVDIAGEKWTARSSAWAARRSPVSYFLGKIGQVFVTGLLQAALAAARGRDAVRHRAADRARGMAHVRMGVRARHRHVGAARDRAVVAAALRQVGERRRRAHHARAAVHLRRYLQFNALPDWMQNIASLFPLMTEDFAVFPRVE